MGSTESTDPPKFVVLFSFKDFSRKRANSWTNKTKILLYRVHHIHPPNLPSRWLYWNRLTSPFQTRIPTNPSAQEIPTSLFLQLQILASERNILLNFWKKSCIVPITAQSMKYPRFVWLCCFGFLSISSPIAQHTTKLSMISLFTTQQEDNPSSPLLEPSVSGSIHTLAKKRLSSNQDICR